MDKRIVTFGEILLRLSKSGCQRLSQGSSLSANYGGSEANVA
ncbi:MAG: sugar kinase, partial [Prevotella sp.]|nr:sugar kinase [Prevotella sp.]